MNIILFQQWPDNHCIPYSDYRGEHIRKVLRLSPGDSFSMGKVNGDRGIATIDSMDETGIHYSFNRTAGVLALHPVTLLVAQVRPICMKRILREAVSLGVEELLVVGADTAERSYGSAKLWSTGEYEKYLLDGAMQAGQTALPRFSLLESIDDFLKRPQHWIHRILLDNVDHNPPLSKAEGLGAPVLLAVGPERGWSDRERTLFVDSGFMTRTLGGRILRTETACSAGLAVLLGRMGLL
ncbi:RsmE family RNA methyltransferase [Pleomorphochaeta sp. DL1XJH-081]|uniref:RsmE family RNA methyltransferase n=1 Tax=Pleomorphochaeta sp. DL1XJH-081 TaxID=3409690 RepID=UPI003BB55D7B